MCMKHFFSFEYLVFMKEFLLKKRHNFLLNLSVTLLQDCFKVHLLPKI